MSSADSLSLVAKWVKPLLICHSAC